MGCKFTFSKEVFNPKYYLTSQFMAKNLNIQPGQKVLDMGTGSGLLAIIAAQKANQVVGIDINPEALAYAQKNAQINHLNHKIKFLAGDLFLPLKSEDKFDLIIFNPPYLAGQPKNDLEKALFDPDQKIITRFFQQAKTFLKPGGYLQILYSSIAPTQNFLKIAKKYHWQKEIIAQKKFLGEEFTIYKFR
jgi:release factor glutamine methyltransferase